MAVLDPGRVSIGFPEAVRSILTEQCPKRSHGDPIQPQNMSFSKKILVWLQDLELFGSILDLQSLSPGEPIHNHFPPGALDPFRRLRRVGRKDFKKIVHSDAPNLEAPDPRWAGELSKLKDLWANQKTPA